MNDDRVPTREQWGDLKVDLDVEYGYRQFGGKTVDEALPQFVAHPIEAAAELRFAPTAVFNYYVFCFATHLTSDASAGEADMASVFLTLVRDRVREDPRGVRAIWDNLWPVVELVARRQEFYDASQDIYGSFANLQREIQAAMA